ncbi:MAG: hypothetical protein CM1200mP10_31540 [Candidatus Neomarinimicrobiota bacterium]|nr:MAG: hypothetical protein CM1200mP10_31540 [Candidatus Neomarinimicrobiota bacterium]
MAGVRDTLKQVGLYRNKYMDYHKIQPVGDLKTKDLMKTGRTMGVFYIESPATRQLLAKAGKVDFEHVVIYSSIIRPAANRYTNLMLDRIHGKSWKLLHQRIWNAWQKATASWFMKNKYPGFARKIPGVQLCPIGLSS